MNIIIQSNLKGNLNEEKIKGFRFRGIVNEIKMNIERVIGRKELT